MGFVLCDAVAREPAVLACMEPDTETGLSWLKLLQTARDLHVSQPHVWLMPPSKDADLSFRFPQHAPLSPTAQWTR